MYFLLTLNMKVLITLEQVVEKKKNRNEQNLDQWDRWCG